MLTVGDCSDEDGGDLKRHVSHNSGRDVDILFYVKDRHGKSIVPSRFTRFDGQGTMKGGSRSLRFDVERNWWLVRTLLASNTPIVQYIFVSKPLKQLMLNFAKEHGEAKEILRRARYVLMQPRDSSDHADHFHVRVYCSEEDKKDGCRDTGPKWSWVAEKKRKRAQITIN